MDWIGCDWTGWNRWRTYTKTYRYEQTRWLLWRKHGRAAGNSTMVKNSPSPQKLWFRSPFVKNLGVLYGGVMISYQGMQSNPFEDTYLYHLVPTMFHNVPAHPGHPQLTAGIMWCRGVEAAEISAASRGSRNGRERVQLPNTTGDIRGYLCIS